MLSHGVGTPSPRTANSPYAGHRLVGALTGANVVGAAADVVTATVGGGAKVANFKGGKGMGGVDRIACGLGLGGAHGHSGQGGDGREGEKGFTHEKVS